MLIQKPPSIGIAVVSPRIPETTSNERLTPVPLKRPTTRRLRYPLKMASEKQSVDEEKEKKCFDRKVQFRPVVVAGEKFLLIVRLEI